jgi:hypothetical protein
MQYYRHKLSIFFTERLPLGIPFAPIICFLLINFIGTHIATTQCDVLTIQGEKMKKLYAMLAFCFGAMAAQAHADPVDVSYTVTGSAGNWNLDFSVANNLGGTNDIYFFGVDLSGRNITGSPTNWDPNNWPTWNNSPYGGSNTTYNNVWIDFGPNEIVPSATLSGFDVAVSDLNAPTSVQWFAVALNGIYTGGGNFNNSSNPGFEGTATSGAAVPEPASLALLGAGVLGVAASRRKKKAQ